jgi:hypothetical protein
VLSRLCLIARSPSFVVVGNRRFRVCIENNLEKYAEAKTKLDKSLIVMSIVDNIREASKKQGGGFVKHVSNSATLSKFKFCSFDSSKLLTFSPIHQHRI